MSGRKMVIEHDDSKRDYLLRERMSEGRRLEAAEDSDDDDDDPMFSSAASCITLRLMGSSFRPSFTHQCFDGERIRGYGEFLRVMTMFFSDSHRKECNSISCISPCISSLCLLKQNPHLKSYRRSSENQVCRMRAGNKIASFFISILTFLCSLRSMYGHHRVGQEEGGDRKGIATQIVSTSQYSDAPPRCDYFIGTELSNVFCFCGSECERGEKKGCGFGAGVATSKADH
eukprot:scaffold139030_cov40-Attheya_sp.AAC.1